MKRGIRSLAVAGVLACLAPFAQAGLIIDEIDVGASIAAGETKMITHDLSSRIPALEIAMGGFLLMVFADDGDSAGETAQITFGGTPSTSDLGLLDLKLYGLNVGAVAELVNGKLNVSVKGLAGDFLWKSSSLYVLTVDNPDGGGSGSGVPEPGTLALLGAMLVGLGLARRAKLV